jgi:hypothetical protein
MVILNARIRCGTGSKLPLPVAHHENHAPISACTRV